MKPFRLGRLGSHILSPGTRRCCPLSHPALRYSIRLDTTVALRSISQDAPLKRKRGRPRKEEILVSSVAPVLTKTEPSRTVPESGLEEGINTEEREEIYAKEPVESDGGIQIIDPENLVPEQLPSRQIDASTSSPKLAALHARLALSSRLPVQTLARTLIDPTADPDPRFNNLSLSVLGRDLLGNYMGEHLLCHYPRLPMAVLYAALFAFIGDSPLASIVKEWGVENAAEPGGEVDPGLLQFRWRQPGSDMEEVTTKQSTRYDKADYYRRGMSSRVVYDDEFGDLRERSKQPAMQSAFPTEADLKSQGGPTATLSDASSTFFRALFGAIYLHSGPTAAHAFFTDHIISRHLDLSQLFTFTHPTRDLSRLCAREGFDSPIARIISETGRLSRHPVFVVGVYSGRDKLGEGAGSSLNEARFKAAMHALKSWYLYHSPGEIMVPSIMEGERGNGRTFKPALIDEGEVVT